MHTYKFNESVKIVNLGDVHRGNKNCNTKLLKKNIDYILANDDVYWVSTGDLLEVALKSSKSSCYDSSSLDDETDDLTKELSPISHKCLGFVRSNHHNRLYKDSGLSLDRCWQRGSGYLTSVPVPSSKLPAAAVPISLSCTMVPVGDPLGIRLTGLWFWHRIGWRPTSI